MSRQTIIYAAAIQVGTKENPPHSGVTKYGDWFGIKGEQWCALFVSWVYLKAGYPLGNIDINNGYRNCQSGYEYWSKTGGLTDYPQMGDIVLFDCDRDGDCDHTGIFYRWLEEGNTFQSYEGNTSSRNNNDGGEVMLRTRNIKLVKAFVSLKAIRNADKA